MNADPQPACAPTTLAPSLGRINSGAALGLGEPASGGTGATPPHVLWETLESAFSASDPQAPTPCPPANPGRLAGYIAMPIALALSLMLWVVIVELVLTR